MKDLHARTEEMTEAAHVDREKLHDLQSKYMSEQSQRLLVEENRSQVKRELTSTLNALHKAEAELREMQKKIVAMEHDMGTLANQEALNRAELGACQMRESELKKELKHMVEVIV